MITGPKETSWRLVRSIVAGSSSVSKRTIASRCFNIAIRSKRIAYPGRIAPEIFQRVKASFLRLENVNKHVAVIDHQPLACSDCFGGEWREAKVLVHPFSTSRTNRFKMRLRIRRANKKIRREQQDTAQLNDYHIIALLV